MKEKPLIFEYLKQWHTFAFNNTDVINPNHGALYFYCINKANEFNWVEKFGLPSEHTMHTIGIASYKTYKKTFDDLVTWGLIKVVQKSENQYTSNIISLPVLDLSAMVKFTEPFTIPPTEPSTKASPKQLPNQFPHNNTINLDTKETKQTIKGAWNDFASKHGKSSILSITPKRSKHLDARLKETGFDFDVILKRCERSSFLLGANKFFSFDWIIESENNYPKILEGKYDDKTTMPETKKESNNDGTLTHPSQSDFVTYASYLINCKLHKLTPQPRDYKIHPEL